MGEWLELYMKYLQLLLWPVLSLWPVWIPIRVRLVFDHRHRSLAMIKNGKIWWYFWICACWVWLVRTMRLIIRYRASYWRHLLPTLWLSKVGYWPLHLQYGYYSICRRYYRNRYWWATTAIALHISTRSNWLMSCNLGNHSYLHC